MQTGIDRRFPETEAPAMHADRVGFFVLAAIALAAICLLTSRSLGQQPGVHAWEAMTFAPAAALFLGIALAVYQRWLTLQTGAACLLTLTTALLLFRIVMLFVDASFDQPGQGLFMPVYAYYGALPLLLVILLPYPQSARFGIAAWLALAIIVTIGSMPYWDDQPRRPYLDATLIYVWLGHGLFIALLFGWARQQQRLVTAHAELALIERQSRLAMADSEQRFRSVFESANVGIGLVGADLRWRTANPRMAEITGYSIGELLGSPLVDVSMPDERDANCARVRAVLSSEARSYSSERRWLRKDGTVTWLLNQVRRIPAPPGQEPSVLFMTLDINDRKQAERAAAEHLRVREFHFANTPLAVIEWTPDLRVERWSAQAEAIFGWRENEIVGKGIADWRFVHDDDLDSVLRVAFQMTAGRESRITTTNRNYRSDGSVIWCEWHNSILRDESGAPVSLISLVQNITDQQQAMLQARHNEQLFRAVFEQAAVGAALLDEAGHWLQVNERLCEIVGYSRDELLQLDFQTITHPDDLAKDAELAAKVARGEIPDYALEKRYRRKDGSVVWIKLFVSSIRATEQNPMRFISIIEDISERKRAEATIRKLASDLELKVAERTQQLQHSMRNWARRNQEHRVLGEMMTHLPTATTSEESCRIIEHYVPRIFALYGGAIWLASGPQESLRRLVQWGGVESAPEQMTTNDCCALRSGEILRVDDPQPPLLCRHLDPAAAGLPHPHTCAPISVLGVTVGMLHLQWSEALDAEVLPPDPVTISNCVKKIGLALGNGRLREELREQATRDPLTGLYNRRHFDATLLRRMAEHQRNGRRFSLLMVDIDHFKRINDQYGHPVGDDVLRAVAALLQRGTRIEESAYRLGGEEFALLIEECSNNWAAGCAERVRREIEAMPVILSGRNLPKITVSIGVATYPRDNTATSSLMQQADIALYTAKRTGRNRVCYASAAVGSEMAMVQLPKA